MPIYGKYDIQALMNASLFMQILTKQLISLHKNYSAIMNENTHPKCKLKWLIKWEAFNQAALDLTKMDKILENLGNTRVK